MSSGIELHSLPTASTVQEPAVNDSTLAKSGTPPTSDALPQSLAPRLKQHVSWERIQLLALYWSIFLAGWNDGSAGPLIPRIQTVYHVNFAIVSLTFVFACVGFISGALINVPLSDKLGFGKVMGSMCQIVAYAIQAPAPPFPVFVLSFVINGVGVAIQDAQGNGYVASLKHNPETKMGLLHGAYGAGALASPLVATQFSQIRHWSFHYLVSLGLAISNSILLLVVFRLRTQDESLALVGEAAGETGTSEHSTFRQILSIRTVHLLAFFILVYVGVEVTLGGWIVTYIIDVRGGGSSSGYVSAGFFGGLMTGRVALLWLNQKIGERRVLYLYSVLAIALELVVWLVPSLIGDAVAVSLVGVLLGPVYPITMMYAGRVLPRWLLTGSIGWIAGFGQAGSAVFPFITGVIASKTGIKALQPLYACRLSLTLLPDSVLG
ncbi:major facilitator superfamily domain-containing protein [Mycena maculata]|uniref:Major facilitator superfamily domain-containing protein n=1 Tax=Mycena maculata TaxID=230809 RepID=A0AAD7NB33_9AGAR|nr:major facilitator superfamily domain-containing protein [Mycena maculata]